MARRVFIKKTDKKNINKFIQLLRQQGIRIAKVLLFGSYAKGNRFSKHSDIDLAVISPEFGRDSIKEMMLLRKLALRIDSHFEPIPLSPAGLADPYSSFSQEIRTYGVVVG